MQNRRLTFALLFWLLLTWFPVMAQELAIGLSGLPPLVARPGEFVTAVFTLENQGTLTDTYYPELFLPQGFSLVAGLTPISVSPATEALVFATVLVPQDATADDFPLQLTVTSKTDPTVSASSVAIIRVVQTAKLDAHVLEGQQDMQDRIEVTFVVVNRGNVSNKIAISVASQSGFEIEFSPQVAELTPGERLKIQVTAHIPAQVGAIQKQERITLIVTSTTFPAVVAQATAVMALTPPPPQRVDTKLSWDMPSQVSIDILESQRPDEFSAASRFTGGGAFDDKRLNTRLMIDNALKVRQAAVELDAPLYRIGLGDVSASFDSFASIAGRGGRLTVRSPVVPLESQLTLVGVFAQEHLSLGLNSRTTFLETNLSVSAVARFEQDHTDSIVSALLNKNLMTVFDISGQAALSTASGFLDSAIKMQVSFAQDPLGLHLQFLRTGPHFSGSNRDQAILDLKQTFSLGPLILQSLLELGLTNVSADPSKQTLGRGKLNIIARALPDMDFPSILVLLDYQTQKELTKTPSVNLQQLWATLSLQQPLKFVSVGVSFSLDRATDYSNKTDDGAIALEALLGWGKDGFSGSLSLSNTFGVDFAAALITDSVFQLGTSFGMNTPLGAFSLKLSNARSLTEIWAELSSHVEDAGFSVSGRLELIEVDLDKFQIKVNVSKRFQLPIPVILTKGQIEGVVFVDANENGKRDAGEGIGNLILLGGGTRAVTNKKGFFRFFPLTPGNYLVNLENLPLGLAASKELPQAVSLRAGQRVRVDLPLKKVSSIEGLVFNDRNKNGQVDAGEKGIPNVRMTLTSAGDITRQARSTMNGRFSFVNIPPGLYTLIPDESTFPLRFSPATAKALSVTVQAQETVPVVVGLTEKAPEIRITFSEPLASFSFSPREPRAEETVEFDASASSDPDGDIVKYEWDFDGDGLADLAGKKVAFVFSVAGEAWVTLTVTDNDGNTGEDTIVIQVKNR